MKKILVISSYAPPAIGGPQILYNLLKDLPIENYNILTSFYNIDNLSAQKGTWLPCQYFFYDNLKKTKEDRIKASQMDTADQKKSSMLLKLKNLAKRNIIIKNIIGAPIIFIQTFWLIKNGKLVIKQKDSDLLLVISDYGPAMISSYFLSKIIKKPCVVYLFDLYRGNFYPFPGGILANVFEKRLLKNASKIIVTNQGTKDFYINRYGNIFENKFSIIHNSISPEPYLPLINPYQSKSPYRIIFTGRINWPQIRSLQNMIKAVNEIDDLDIQFHIYSPNTKDFLNKVGIVENSKIKIATASPTEMPQIQSQADILFLPLSWKTKSQAIIDTATPGKFTDYLIAGRPILIHAPASSYLVKYARDNNIAAIVDNENLQNLKNTIKKIVKDIDFSQEIIKNAQILFFKNHDINKNVDAFRSLFE
jgi:glycosyltransferase involved in cell wall biosynthesis